MITMNKLNVIISGGGTGGHIFPAISIANELKAQLGDGVNILFVGAQGRMEMEKVPAAGYAIEGLWISGLQRKLSPQNLLLPFKIVSSLIKAHRIINAFKPQLVIGVGGYASAIIMKAANQRNIPTLIQEQNSYPGITNKMLAGGASKICVAYANMDNFFSKSKLVLTGNPIRKEISDMQVNKADAYTYFNLNPNKKTILIVGGSLGALTINEAIKNASLLLPTDVQLVWQTGKNYYASATTMASDVIHVYDFIARMDYAFSVADVVISRAGAGTLSELCVVGKPVVLVPSPNVAEDHQTHNAMALVNSNAAVLIKDVDAKIKLMPATLALINDVDKCATLSKNIISLAKPNAAKNIVAEALALVKL
jgi:UDP-N-acetylglucosamine--N-acetylmuramyl-(pentapeptide) pyrophosphoryl-undecaprenol N-acetylglucosamine transferase